MSSTCAFSSRLLPWFAAAMVVLALPVSAGQLYQWKDAQGVSHYSDAPPAGQAYKDRKINNNGQTTVPVVAKPVVVNANCSNARSNLKVLQGTQAVGVDDNKDGKPDRDLSVKERANRTVLAEAQIRTYCEDAAPAVVANSN